MLFPRLVYLADICSRVHSPNVCSVIAMAFPRLVYLDSKQSIIFTVHTHNYCPHTITVHTQLLSTHNNCPHTITVHKHNYCPHTIHLFHSTINSCRKATPSLQLTSKHICGLFNLRRIYRQPVRSRQVENICTNSPFPLRGMYPQVGNICQMYRLEKLVLIEDCTLHEDTCTFVIISL